MEFLKNFFLENLIVIFFIYGASFYVLSFSIIFSTKILQNLNITRPFVFLLLFGFTHGTVELMDMFSILGSKSFGVVESSFYAITKAGLLSLSFAFLLIFSIKVVTAVMLKSEMKGTYLTPFILSIALLHFGISFFYGEPVSVRYFDATVRYLVAFPASVLSAIGIYFLSRDKELHGKLPEKAGTYLRIAALGFLIYGILAGLVVPESDVFIDYESFLTNVGLPVQAFRAATAVFIAYLFVMAMALNLTLRVWCAYGIVLATICAIGISTFSTSKQIVTSQTNTAKLYKEEEHFHNLGITFAKISKYLLTHRKMDRREFERLKVDFEKELDYLNDIAHKDEEEGILISRIGEGYRKLINEDIQKLIRDERAHLLIEKISGDINAIATIHRKEMLLHLTEISRLLRHSFITHGIGLIAALVIFLFVGYRFVKIIVIPIGILEHGVVEIRKGNLNHRIELRTGDEFQDIAEEYNRMAQTVIDREQKLKNAKDLMERLSITDAITGLFNYRYFFETLGNEIERARRYKTDLSLLMLDIDHFKHYNDMHGHPRGNDALKRVACMLGDNIRRIDIPCRYGGEEFAVILPSVDKKGALIAAEKIRSSIESHPFPFRESQPKGIFTVSIGVATYPDDAKGVEELIKKADDALYRAKSTGRNRVSVA